MKQYKRPHEYSVVCTSCNQDTVVHTRIKRIIKRCPRCGATRPAITVRFLQTNTTDPVVR